MAVSRRRLWSYSTPARSLGGGRAAGRFTRPFNCKTRAVVGGERSLTCGCQGGEPLGVSALFTRSRRHLQDIDSTSRLLKMLTSRRRMLSRCMGFILKKPETPSPRRHLDRT